jgi:hypothetical protein
MLAPDFIREEIDRLRILIDKTAGESETRAFEILTEFIDRSLRETSQGHHGDSTKSN